MKLFSKLFSIVLLSGIALSCCQEPQYATRAEKILAEMRNPNSDYVLVASHRGDWRNYPENSIPAIESVIRMGVDIVELDVKMTKDSVIVLSHDNSTRRCTNWKGEHGSGVDKQTLAEIKNLKLKTAHGVTTDSLRMPTLEEAFLVCKDRIIINIDQGFQYYDLIMPIAEKVGITEQLLIKGGAAVDFVNAKMNQYENKMMYMPIVSPKRDNCAALDSFIAAGQADPAQKPLAYELCYGRQNSPADYKEAVDKVRAAGSRAWVNTLWPTLSGLGYDDDAALEAFVQTGSAAPVYGAILETGVSMIQTDRPELLLNYLRSVGRHD
jgi:glycerophosphoryl diester phosphodiesterase